MLEIVKYPDPRLKQVSQEVTVFDAKLHKLLDAMAITMYAANGVGLAAIQVGEPLRAFLVDIGESEKGTQKLLEFINPKIVRGESKIVYEEGCLSVPGITEEVTRRGKILVKYQDRFGKEHEMEADGLTAVAIQHENDHLDGILFVERLSPLRRRLMRKKIEKAVAI